MGYKRSYVWRDEQEENGSNGHKPCDILCQHYNDETWATIVLSKQDFETLTPWLLCSLLNQVYKNGREDAMADLRRMMGVQ